MSNPNESPMNQGPAPEPRESSIELPPNEHVVDPNELSPPSPGEGWESGMQESAPPQAPAAAAETAELKQKLGQALHAIGELKQENAQRTLDAQVNATLADVSKAVHPEATPVDFSQFPKDKLNQNLTVQDFMTAMQTMMPKLVAEANAQVLRQNWDVTPQEQQAALQRYPQLAQYPQGSPEQLTAIKKVVDLLRSSAQPAQVAPSAGSAPAQQTRPAQRTVPMVEQSTPSEMADNAGSDVVAQAQADYEKAKLIKNPKERINAMRSAFDRIKAAAGVSQDSIHNSNWRNSS